MFLSVRLGCIGPRQRPLLPGFIHNEIDNPTMPYATIHEGEATPLQIPHDGYSADSTGVAPSTKKRASSIIVRAMMVGTAMAMGTLLLMAGHSKMMTRNSSRNVDGMVVVSSTATQDSSDCAPATGTFSGLSCKDSNGYCAGPHGLWEEPGVAKALNHFETCFVSNNPPPNDRCWSRSHGDGGDIFYVKTDVIDHNYIMNNYQVDTVAPKQVRFIQPEDGTGFYRCDPVGYFDGDSGYDQDGVWHVSTPLSDGSCGNPCREFK